MGINFFKYQALGNDFIIVEDLAQEMNFSKGEIRGLCDRHFGVGADGVILVRRATSDASDPSAESANPVASSSAALAPGPTLEKQSLGQQAADFLMLYPQSFPKEP